MVWYMPKSVLPMFSSKSFIVSGFIFKSLIHFEFIFVYGVRKCSSFILLHGSCLFLFMHCFPSFYSSLCISFLSIFKRVDLKFFSSSSKVFAFFCGWIITFYFLHALLFFHWKLDNFQYCDVATLDIKYPPLPGICSVACYRHWIFV